ncbi:MAG TPA: hypothetical protein VGG25_02255 [Streptosporangiaceae bacterium]|jgi:hypothetical protein
MTLPARMTLPASLAGAGTGPPGLVTLPPPKRPAEVVARLQDGMGELPFWWKPRVPLAPLVLTAAAYAELAGAARALLALIRRAVDALGATAMERNERLGMDPRFAVLYGDEATEAELAGWQYRPDVVLTAAGPKFIEFNVSAATGGMPHTHYIQRAWQRIFAGAGLRCASPFAVRAAALDRLCAARGLPRSVALVKELRPDPTEAPVYGTQVSYLRGLGYRADALLAEELADYAGPRYGVALRQVVAQERLDAGTGLDPLVRGAANAQLTLAPQSSYLLANKQVLALLSAGQPWMSAADTELARRYLPWTRPVADGPAQFRGRTRDLPALLLAERRSLVLKNGTGNSGQQVIIGKITEPGPWERAVAAALAQGTWTVQEFAEPASFPAWLWDTDSASAVLTPVSGVLSPYVVDGRDAGCMLRYDLDNARALVTVAQPSVRFNTVMYR